ncbi:MAG: phosphatase PAP2 family protein [Acidimicrobiales bacterium]
MDTIIRVVGQYFFLISVVVVCLYWLKVKTSVKISLAWDLIAGGVLALVLDLIAGDVYYDPRPFVTHHLVPIIAHAADNGFPSDHALLTSFLAFTLFLYSKRTGIFLFVIALLVSWARVAANIHSPLDIAGGFIIAAFALFVVHSVARLWRRRSHAIPLH